MPFELPGPEGCDPVLVPGVSVPDQGKEPVPLAALSIRFRPATVQSVEMGLSVAASVAQWRGTLGDVLVDREYTRSIAGEEFILPIRALGC